jgi:hypothetical protein
VIAAVTALVVVGLGVGLGITYASSDDIDAPSGLSATALSPTSVQLDWTGAKDADTYVVKVGSDRSLSGATTREVPGKSTRLTVSDLPATTPGIDRFYRVDAVHDGKVRSSRTARFTLKPGAIDRVSIAVTTADGVKAGWNKVANARQFDVAIARDKSFTRALSTVRTLDSSHTFATRGLTPATTYWIKVRPVNGDQSGVFSKPVKFTTMVRESSFRIGTWNVCSEKCSGYAGRARIMAAFLNASKVDIFGLQEAGGQRVGRTTNAIFSGGSQKFRRATGGAEARYIFYRPALFQQLSGGYFAVGDGRHATWARFKVRKTGRIFYYVDVHLENGKGNDAKRSREMNVLLARMARINDTDKPIVFAGDFNSGRHRSADSPGVKMRAAGLDDTVYLVKSPVNADISTSHSFSGTVLRAAAYVDHIFVSKDFDVMAWKQLVRITDGRYTQPVVSDHNALSAVVALDAKHAPLGELTATTTVGGLTSSLR